MLLHRILIQRMHTEPKRSSKLWVGYTPYRIRWAIVRITVELSLVCYSYLVGLRLGLWFALSFSPKPSAGKTINEVLAEPVSRYLKLLIATFAAIASYFLDASEAWRLYLSLHLSFTARKFSLRSSDVVFGNGYVVEAVELQLQTLIFECKS